MNQKKKEITRRKFLSGAAAGVAAASMAGFTPVISMADDTTAEKTAPEKIITRKLGRTGMEIPIVSMGVMNANNPSLVQASYELGMRHFDTAAYYQFGRNEQMVGKVINQMKVRDKVRIATKIFAGDQRDDVTDSQIKGRLAQLLDGSLSRLKFDYVDILHIHSVDDPAVVSNPGVLEGVAALKESKKALAVGISTHRNMTAVINEMLKHDVYDVVLTSFNFTLAGDTDLLTAVDNAAKKGIGVVAMKTMAGGARWPNPESRQDYSMEVITRAINKWVMRNENICTCIPGYTNFDHMKLDFSIVGNLEYTEEEAKFLKDNNALASIDFCRQCQKCLASCPNNVDIPELMRTHMYAARYGNIAHARRTLDEIPKANSLQVCTSCNTCTAQCANTVDIGNRINELKLMYT